ncbi:hypothetical protein Celaphus_00009578 [Cervus elaphus hippelaphus]|uniref:Uncharacterized protein n=1 Tax=Cervus elaphus hippelaphus TaxID=46360 RepID=A0A212C0K2_CEREH|nr:hypothetical protein Celaphus_00009578 [Cervus elaphus hippelaphus]
MLILGLKLTCSLRVWISALPIPELTLSSSVLISFKSLKDAQLAKSWINGIVLVGGSTCIPNCIPKLLKDFLNGEELSTTTHADEASRHVVRKHRRRFSRATDYRLHRAAQCSYCDVPDLQVTFDKVTSTILSVPAADTNAGRKNKIQGTDDEGWLSKSETD